MCYSQTSKYLSGGKMEKEIHEESLGVSKARRKAGFECHSQGGF